MLLSLRNAWPRSDDRSIALQTPTHEKKSATVATLPPGNYTAIVRGRDGTTGVGLVELYNVH